MNEKFIKAAVCVWGVMSFGPLLKAGYEEANNPVYSVAAIERRHDECFRHLGETAVRRPLPLDCLGVLLLTPAQTSPELLYDLPARDEAHLYATDPHEVSRQHKEVATLAGFIKGGTVFAWGLFLMGGLSGYLDRRRARRAKPSESP